MNEELEFESISSTPNNAMHENSYQENDCCGDLGDDELNELEEDDEDYLCRSESAEILSKKYLERDLLKQNLVEEAKARRMNKFRKRQQQIRQWEQKTAASPFRVNLVAETERLDEEHRIQQAEAARQARLLEKQARDAKTEVILKVLTEGEGDLDQLRREKRAILEEEKRLKALLDLEKTNAHRKADLLAAKHAEKQRKQMREEERRKVKRQEVHERDEKYRQLLKEKLAIE